MTYKFNFGFKIDNNPNPTENGQHLIQPRHMHANQNVSAYGFRTKQDEHAYELVHAKHIYLGPQPETCQTIGDNEKRSCSLSEEHLSVNSCVSERTTTDETSYFSKAKYKNKPPSGICKQSLTTETSRPSPHSQNQTKGDLVVDPVNQSLYTDDQKVSILSEIPNGNDLDKIVERLGRKSGYAIDICDRICRLIRRADVNIINVWAAYYDAGKFKDKIVFVVFVKKEISADNIQGYRCVFRKVGYVNDEGKNVIRSDEFDKYRACMSHTENLKLRNAINNNNVELMRKHRYLTIISGSPVRSKGFGSTHTIVRESCIVLYVYVKGCIPINEEPFPAHYDGVPTDVREGLFKYFGAGAKDFQRTLKSGCQIYRYMTGTLGGFINHHEFGTCGITSGHVLLKPDELKSFHPGLQVQDWYNPHADNIVYQPVKIADSSMDTSCGMLVRAIYNEGGGGESGIDVAIFQVEKRYPDSGDFPSLSDGRSSEMCYVSGKTAGVTRLGSGGRVIKFGATTERTDGVVISINPLVSVKLPEYTHLNTVNTYTIKLHNLLEVKSDTPFADEGDSGALVFCIGEAEELFCVGMIEGGTSAGTCVVMPIAPILQRLHILGLKSFEKNKLEEKVDKGFKDMDKRFDELLAVIKSKSNN